MSARPTCGPMHPSTARPAPGLCAALVFVITLAASPGLVSAQALDANLWVTDGDVSVIAPLANTIYVGGNFGYVGPNTGGWVEVDAAGHATPRLPRLDGDVTATAGDGAGGWFVAGAFTHVAGIARAGLARVLADGSVSAWAANPAPTGSVTSAVHAAGRLFVATDTGQLVAYDDAAGNLVGGWAPAVAGTVSSLALDGTTLYAAGDITFTTSGSISGNGIAAINTATGAIANWDPAPDAPVTLVRAEGRWLYASGTFFSIGGQSHQCLARALLSTRVFDAAWAPSLDQPAATLATVGSGLWIGGAFVLVNSDLRDRAAVIDTTSGATLALTPGLSAVDGTVTAMVVRQPYVYLGLSPLLVFNLGGTAKPLALRLFAATGGVDKTWRVLGEGGPTSAAGNAGSFKEILFTPTGVVATGHFISAGGRRQVAAAAFDRLTGLPTAWDPALSVDEPFPTVPSVTTIVPTDHAIYLGGYFTHAGAQVRKSLAAVDLIRGSALSWSADLGPVVSLEAGSAAALALFGDKLVVGGAFSTIKGVAHASLAQVDTVTGTPVAGWSCDVTGSVNCLLVRGTTVFVGGGFSNVGGQARGHIAAVTGANGSVLPWNPGGVGVQGVQVWAFAASNDTLYIGGDFSNAGGPTRVCLAAVSASAGTLLGWAPQAFGPVRTLVIDGPNVLVGGEYQFIAGQPTAFLAGLHRATAALATGIPGADGNVLALAKDNGSLYTGGSFGTLAQGQTAYFGRAGAADGAGPNVLVVAANGGEYVSIGSTYRFEYTAGDPSGVASVDLELSRTGSGGPWTPIVSGIRNTGHYEWQATGPAAASNAFLRVTARDFAGNAANDRSNLAFSIGVPIAGVDPTLEHGPLVSLTLGPNPARGRTELRFALLAPVTAKFRLLDVQGREVWASPRQSYAAGEHVMACGLEHVPSGIYFMRCEHASGSRDTRLIVFR